jgi:two-component system, OmpR family, sensor histidine kinase MtrB
MPERRPANLRNVLSFAAVLVTLLAATAATSLVLATSVLQKMTADIAASVESVHAIEEAEVTLLLHVRAQSRGEQRESADQVRAWLDQAERYATSSTEARALDDVRVAVDRYFEVAAKPDAAPAELEQLEAKAIEALERLGEIDLASTRAAHERAIQWDRIANFAGLVLAFSIVVITALLVLWLRRRVIRPLFALAETMKRFGAGERELRAVEEGPTELRDMTHRFNDMAESIAAQRQAQTAFLGGVAHDLRNPLSALKLAVELLDPNQPLPSEAQLRRTIGIISRQINQLERMVGDFLDMAKIEAGELELSIADHDIRAIVGDSIELFEPTSRSRFHVAMPDVPIVVACDAVRIGQAITNLVSNAIKYSPPDEPIDIKVATAGDEVTIEVTDRGVGIPRADHERIFEPFRRGATRHNVPGTGLGLYNVQRIVQAHAGRIEVDSVPSVGSTFRVRLTTSRSYSDPLPTPAPSAVAGSARPH